MEKRVIIALSIILVALIGIIFIISLLFNNNKKTNEEPLPIEQGEELPVDVFSSLLSIKGIVEGINITQGGYQYMNENSDISNIVEKMRNDLSVTNVRSNVDIENRTFCFSLKDSEGNNLCIDNVHGDVLQGFNCNNSKLCEAEIINLEEPEIIPNPEQIIPEEQAVPILKQEVTVGETLIKRYDDSGDQIIYINDKEYGPYEQAYIIYNEIDWGLLLLYKGSWYVNINGKAKGPYVERPVVESYGEELGYSYVKDDQYYVVLNNEIYGPYEDLIEFDINNK